MRIRCTPKLEVLALLVLASVMLAPTASAAVIGHLTFDNCGSGGAIVTLTTIDFFLPLLGGNGCIMTGGGTNITYSGGGPLGASDTGTVNDLGFTPAANIDFIAFAGNPNLHFDLTGLGPGPINTGCANSTNVNGIGCAVFPGSPFLLAPNGHGTTVTLPVNGVAHDTSSTSSTWTGAFTTQLNGRTPASIQTNILSGNSESSTWSFEGDVTAVAVSVPEPVTMAMIGGGLIAFATLRRRRSRT